LDQAEERVLTELRGAREEQRDAQGPGLGLAKGPGEGLGKGIGSGKGSGVMAVETTKRKWHEDSEKGVDKEKGSDKEKGQDKGGKKRKGSQ